MLNRAGDQCLENFHILGLKSQKYHTLDQVVDSIRDVDVIKYHRCGLYNSAHNHFKLNCEKNRSI